MDNLTHTLAGLTLAELLVRAPKKSVSPRLRLSVYAASIIANNFPDLDFVYTGITTGKLGYLLHHRGHTHTLIVAIPTMFFLFGLFFAFQKVKKWKFERWENALVLTTFGLGPVIHIFLDFLNSYGVHPFWPWNNKWYYADTLFIVEPAVWAAVLPFLLKVTQSRNWRIFLWALVILTYGLVLFTGMVPVPGMVFTCAIGATAFIIARFTSGSLVPVGLVASWILVISIFFTASQKARGVFHLQLATHAPGTSVDELALSPLPSNPFCWSLLSAESTATELVSRRGLIATYPKILRAENCPNLRGSGSTARRRLAAIPSGERVRWTGDVVQDLREFREIATTHCGAQGFLRFSRVPYLEKTAGGVNAVDLRFDWQDEMSFAEIAFHPDEPCPKNLPGWEAPRGSWIQ